MKMYRSLVYREWRLSRGHYILMTILFLLTETVFILPVLVEKQSILDNTAEDIKSIKLSIAVIALLQPLSSAMPQLQRRSSAEK